MHLYLFFAEETKSGNTQYSLGHQEMKAPFEKCFNMLQQSLTMNLLSSFISDLTHSCLIFVAKIKGLLPLDCLARPVQSMMSLKGFNDWMSGNCQCFVWISLQCCLDSMIRDSMRMSHIFLEVCSFGRD
jgi:hypothetical protein